MWALTAPYVLAGIPPAELHRRAASLALACHVMDPDHLLHHTITRGKRSLGWGLGAPLPQAGEGGTFCRLPCPMGQGPTGWLGCGRKGGSRPPVGCMSVLSHHPGAARDLALCGRPGSSSVGCALEWGTSVLMCFEVGPVQESGLQLPGRPADIKSHRHWVPPPLCCPPGGFRVLIGVDGGARARGWLLGRFPEIWLFLLFFVFVFGFTCKKKKKTTQPTATVPHTTNQML